MAEAAGPSLSPTPRRPSLGAAAARGEGGSHTYPLCHFPPRRVPWVYITLGYVGLAGRGLGDGASSSSRLGPVVPSGGRAPGDLSTLRLGLLGSDMLACLAWARAWGMGDGALDPDRHGTVPRVLLQRRLVMEALLRGFDITNVPGSRPTCRPVTKLRA